MTSPKLVTVPWEHTCVFQVLEISDGVKLMDSGGLKAREASLWPEGYWSNSPDQSQALNPNCCSACSVADLGRFQMWKYKLCEPPE